MIEVNLYCFMDNLWVWKNCQTSTPIDADMFVIKHVHLSMQMCLSSNKYTYWCRCVCHQTCTPIDANVFVIKQVHLLMQMCLSSNKYTYWCKCVCHQTSTPIDADVSVNVGMEYLSPGSVMAVLLISVCFVGGGRGTSNIVTTALVILVLKVTIWKVWPVWSDRYDGNIV